MRNFLHCCLVRKIQFSSLSLRSANENYYFSWSFCTWTTSEPSENTSFIVAFEAEKKKKSSGSWKPAFLRVPSGLWGRLKLIYLRASASARNEDIICCRRVLLTGRLPIIDLMPDKRAGSWRGMWPGRGVAAYSKSVFSTQFSVTFTFLFPQHSRLLSSKKRELATQFSFLCMPTTVSGSNSWSFAIIGGQSLEVWQHALRISDWRYRRSEIFQALLPFFFSLLAS